jgi:putative addiction module component (TIGR02574 family)
MAVHLSDLLALPADERLRLAEALWASVAPEDLEPLAREFIRRVARTNEALDATIRRLGRLDETLKRDRAEVREATRRAAEEWPFYISPSSNAQ